MKSSVPTTKPPKGWKPWFWGRPWINDELHDLPMNYSEVELWREGCRETWRVRPAHMHPSANVYGLFWRPSGERLLREKPH